MNYKMLSCDKLNQLIKFTSKNKWRRNERTSRTKLRRRRREGKYGNKLSFNDKSDEKQICFSNGNGLADWKIMFQQNFID
jgi:hypothetical protein